MKREKNWEQPSTDAPAANDEQPPFGRSWATLYAVVLVNLAVLVVLFYLFTRAFA
ncbi:MAG TPA: hypothetical protein VFS10_11770 [Pyrinomonadaceae bacterium]|nr:hypothetical protein [Pyrinomonadaceae bacterium]